METPDELYKQLVDKIKEYHPTDNFEMLEKAYNVAREAHKEQKRKSGDILLRLLIFLRNLNWIWNR